MSKLLDLTQHIRKQITRIEREFPYASALGQQESGLAVTTTTREDNIAFSDPVEGIVFTLFTGSFFIENATADLTEKGITLAVDELMVAGKPYLGKKPEKTIDPGEKIEKSFEQPMVTDPWEIGPGGLLEKARKNRSQIEPLSDKIMMAANRLGFSIKNELFVNRNKTLHQTIRRFDNVFYMIFANNDRTAEMFGGYARVGGFEHSELDWDQVKTYTEHGLQILSSERLKPGTYDCIFSPAMSGMFAHEAFGHGTETDMFLKKRARGEQYMNKQVAATSVNMWDSPALEGIDASGSYFFDHEGQLSTPTLVIKNGILVSGLTDMNSAMNLGIRRTPNGRRESYSHKPYARMTNTYFEKGSDTFDSMLKSIEYGFLIDHATNGMEDPKGWGIQLEALYAAEIKDGKLTGKVFSPIIVTGYVPDLLMSISMKGDTFHISSGGYCGKGHKEWVKVTDGGPYLKLKARLA